MLWPGLVCVIMDLLGGWQMIQFKDMLDLISHHNIHFKHAQEYCLNWICRFSWGKGKSLFFLAKQFFDQRQGRTWQNFLYIWLQKVNHVHMHGTDYQRRSMQIAEKKFRDLSWCQRPCWGWSLRQKCLSMWNFLTRWQVDSLKEQTVLWKTLSFWISFQTISDLLMNRVVLYLYLMSQKCHSCGTEFQKTISGFYILQNYMFLEKIWTRSEVNKSNKKKLVWLKSFRGDCPFLTINQGQEGLAEVKVAIGKFKYSLYSNFNLSCVFSCSENPPHNPHYFSVYCLSLRREARLRPATVNYHCSKCKIWTD